MPRIRTLKPEHKQHRKVGMLTHRQYRLWIGMVTEADDDGRLVADPAQLRALVFAYHPTVTIQHVRSDLQSIASVGLVRLYRVSGVDYADFPSWRDHQRLDRSHYLMSRLPPFAASSRLESASELECAVSPREDRESMTPRLPLDSDASTSRQGSEGNLTTQGREGNHATAPPAPSLDSTAGNGHPTSIPAPVAKALERMPLLGPQLRDPAWWQSELRAHPTLDVVAEALRAEAWCRSNPTRSPRRNVKRFLHSWFERAESPR